MRSLCNKINLKLKFCTENRIKNSPMIFSKLPEVLKKTSGSFLEVLPKRRFFILFLSGRD